MDPTPRRGGLALVLTGGGARAAYQVGVLRFLAGERPDLPIPILTGVSAGSINASFLACRNGTFSAAVHRLVEIWLGMSVDRLFRTGPFALVSRAGRMGLRLSSGGLRYAPHAEGLVDTQPMRRFLEQNLGRVDGEFNQLESNFARGALSAFAITAIDWSTGETVDWIAGPGLDAWKTPNRRAEICAIGVEQVMGSSAIPILFPAVRVAGSWYGDGGVREADPLFPAAHLGADRILAVSTKPSPTVDGAPIFGRRRYPPLAQILGVLSNAIFLDVLEDDFARLERHRQLVEMVPPEQRGPERPVRGLLLRPSQDIGLLAARYESRLPATFRFLLGGVGTREVEGGDFISLIMFVSEYLASLIDLGHRDAEARGDELLAFVDG